MHPTTPTTRGGCGSRATTTPTSPLRFHAHGAPTTLDGRLPLVPPTPRGCDCTNLAPTTLGSCSLLGTALLATGFGHFLFLGYAGNC